MCHQGGEEILDEDKAPTVACMLREHFSPRNILYALGDEMASVTSYTLRPHPLSFTPFYLSAVAPLILTLVLQHLPIPAPHATDILVLIACVSVGLLIWVYDPKKSAPFFTLPALYVALFITSETTLPLYTLVALNTVLWLALYELYRNSVVYHIDEKGVTIRCGVLRRTERFIPYSSVLEVVVARSLWDRLVGIGSVVVLTATHLSQEFSVRGVGAGVYYGKGGIQYSLKPSTCIYGVRRWREVRDYILQHLKPSTS